MESRLERLHDQVTWLMKNKYDTYETIGKGTGLSNAVICHFLTSRSSYKKTIDRLEEYVRPRIQKYYKEYSADI